VGYYLSGSPAVAGAFTPTSPARVLDTRRSVGAAPPGPNAAATVRLTGRASVPATGVSAVLLTVTAVSPARRGHLTVHSHGSAVPYASDLNFDPHHNVANMVVAPVDASGKIDIYNASSGATHLLADVAGYFRMPAPPNSMSGTVTSAATNAGLAGVEVTAYSRTDPEIYYMAITAFDGTYLLTHVGPSDYDVYFDAQAASGGESSTGYLDEAYDDVPWDHVNHRVATPVTMTRGGVRTGIDAGLARGSAITGRVTSAERGFGLSGVTVGFTDVEGSYTFSTRTGADGTYSMRGLPASVVGALRDGYRVCFNPNGARPMAKPAGYLDTCFPVRVKVAADTTTPYINAALIAAGMVTGTVTGGGAPLTGVAVRIRDGDGTMVAATTTGADGSYRSGALPPASLGYSVCFDPAAATGGTSDSGYLPECFDNTPPDWTHATPVHVISGRTTAGIDADVGPAGAIAGRVTADGVGAWRTHFTVTRDGDYVAEGDVQEDGTYRVVNLEPGDYTVCFAADRVIGTSPTGYVDECYKNAPTAATATPVTVTAGTTTTRINAALEPAGGVSGTVTTATGGAALADVGIAVFQRTGGSFVPADGAATADDGTYLVKHLAPGATYAVCFDASIAAGGTSTTGYADECYDNISWIGDAFHVPSASASIVVGSGEVRSGIDATLANG
jgi:hypothetical protein